MTVLLALRRTSIRLVGVPSPRSRRAPATTRPMALAETTTLRTQMDQTRERQKARRATSRGCRASRGIETDRERTREIRSAG
jgi:hypothetical protein